MTDKPTLHFIEPSSRARAEFSRMGFDLGHHCEVYGDVAELTAVPPRSGIILARDFGNDGGIANLIERLSRYGVSQPIVALAEAPTPEQIVIAIKAGALDYLALPLVPSALSKCLARLAQEAEAYAEARSRMIEARGRISHLSNREREVLDWLTRGCSNKVIARELEISPRTVEIHRANMMSKLGANHPADAVRLKLEAQL